MTPASLAPVDPRGTVLGDEVYTRIGEAILDGTLQPGEHLRDHELARRFGVSRTPVREALQRLERTGLVEVAPNRYTRVSIPDAKALDDTHEFVVHLIASISRLAVRRASDEALAEMLALLDRVVEASRADDKLGILDASAVLFELMTHAADNRAFLRVLREGELAIRRNLAGWRPVIACPVSRTAGYERFRDAVAARDADAAEHTFLAVNGFD